MSTCPSPGVPYAWRTDFYTIAEPAGVSSLLPASTGLLPRRFLVTIRTGFGAISRGNGWKLEHERRAAVGWLEPKLAAHPLGELARDREAEPAAGRARPVQSGEAGEDLIAVLGRNAGPIVLDPESAAVGDDAHVRRGRCMQERVVDERPPDLEHALPVTEYRSGGVDDDLELVLAADGERLQLLPEIGGDGRERQRLQLDPHAPGVPPGKGEQG